MEIQEAKDSGDFHIHYLNVTQVTTGFCRLNQWLLRSRLMNLHSPMLQHFALDRCKEVGNLNLCALHANLEAQSTIVVPKAASKSACPSRARPLEPRLPRRNEKLAQHLHMTAQELYMQLKLTSQVRICDFPATQLGRNVPLEAGPA